MSSRMIQNLKIRNFLSISKADIEFHEGINVIVGESFAGKSNIFRAIEEVVIEPGTHVVRAGKSKAIINATINNHIIKRAKGKGTNSYKVGETKYSSVGRSIPDEIKDAVNVSWLDKICVSISPQTAPRFLLDASPSVAAKALASISGLDKLLKAIEIADKEGRKAKQRMSFLKEEKQKYNNLKKQGSKLLPLSNKIMSLVGLMKQLKCLKEERGKIVAKQLKKEMLEDRLKQTKSSLEKVTNKLLSKIKSCDICPLSGAELFESCKEKIIASDS